MSHLSGKALIGGNMSHNNEWVFDYLVSLIHSPLWAAEVLSFIDEYCIVFDNEEENKLAHFELHLEFIKLIDQFLSARLKEVGISVNDFLKSCAMTKRHIDFVDQQVYEQIFAIGDFLVFKKIMTTRNIELEKEVHATILQSSKGDIQNTRQENKHNSLSDINYSQNNTINSDEKKINHEFKLQPKNDQGSLNQNISNSIKGEKIDTIQISAGPYHEENEVMTEIGTDEIDAEMKINGCYNKESWNALELDRTKIVEDISSFDSLASKSENMIKDEKKRDYGTLSKIDKTQCNQQRSCEERYCTEVNHLTKDNVSKKTSNYPNTHDIIKTESKSIESRKWLNQSPSPQRKSINTCPSPNMIKQPITQTHTKEKTVMKHLYDEKHRLAVEIKQRQDKHRKQRDLIIARKRAERMEEAKMKQRNNKIIYLRNSNDRVDCEESISSSIKTSNRLLLSKSLASNLRNNMIAQHGSNLSNSSDK